jgi:hypothetical protein
MILPSDGMNMGNAVSSSEKHFKLDVDIRLRPANVDQLARSCEPMCLGATVANRTGREHENDLPKGYLRKLISI